MVNLWQQLHPASNTFGDESVSNAAMSRNALEKKQGLHCYEMVCPLPSLVFLVISARGCSSFCLSALLGFALCCFVVTTKKCHLLLPLGKGKDMTQWKETLQKHNARILLSIHNQRVSLKWHLQWQVSPKEDGPSPVVFNTKETCSLRHQFIHSNPLRPVATDDIDDESRKSFQSHTCTP